MTNDNILRMSEAPSKKEIDEKLKSSLDLLYQHDSHLLKEDLDEISISHRLALYLQQKFDAWHVDCEYNRNLGDTKRIDNKPVRPDIIIHRRGTTDNLIAIEIKKLSSNPADDNDDKKKLEGYKSGIGYQHAIFLKIGTGSKDCGKYSFTYV